MHANSFYGHYEPEGKLTQIRLNGFVIWDQGQVITQEVAAVYALISEICRQTAVR